MKLRLLIALAAISALSLTLTGCGVKEDLEKPNIPAQKNDKDPSRPPAPLGR